METIELHPAATTAQTPAKVDLCSVASTGDRRPPLFVPADELLFWTREWRAGEAESKAEREAGNIRTFESGEDVVAWLQSDD